MLPVLLGVLSAALVLAGWHIRDILMEKSRQAAEKEMALIRWVIMGERVPPRLVHTAQQIIDQLASAHNLFPENQTAAEQWLSDWAQNPLRASLVDEAFDILHRASIEDGTLQEVAQIPPDERIVLDRWLNAYRAMRQARA